MPAYPEDSMFLFRAITFLLFHTFNTGMPYKELPLLSSASLFTYAHTYIHTYKIIMYIHTYAYKHSTYIHTILHTIIHTYIHTYNTTYYTTYTYIHMLLQTILHTYMHKYYTSCILYYLYACIHTYIRRTDRVWSPNNKSDVDLTEVIVNLVQLIHYLIRHPSLGQQDVQLT